MRKRLFVYLYPFLFSVTCEPLPIIAGGNYSITNCSDASHLPDTLCSVECYDGYILYGPADYSCLDSGLWSDTFNSTCQGIYSLFIQLTTLICHWESYNFCCIGIINP